MSEGETQPPKAPVVAEAHEVDTYHGKFFRARSDMAMTRANNSVVPKAFFEYVIILFNFNSRENCEVEAQLH